MDMWPDLEEELIRYRDVSISIKRILCIYEKECQTIIKQMKGKSFDDVQMLFERLYDIQGKLSIALYKYGFMLSDELHDFVYHFERDDIYSRKHWYQKFNEGMTWPNDD
ncbi:hypothetical protein P7V88_004306 [Salmonella enterica]|nr:hypothetical protein [Salmonella enterica subsp. enterica]EDU0380517.1 hypothetical protein [Salmonella enterica subsp. enterica]EGT9726112.1 hypothetical protein [Salmonella enterica]EHW1158041.1 hypothetical protein [Salmonella enterica subsp. enterica serovar Takoradi]EKR0896035.1 hypothetical protein [Salmonella enterica]